MTLKLLVDGEEVCVRSGVTVVVECSDDEIADLELLPGANLYFYFTREGEIRDYVYSDGVKEIDAATYQELLERAVGG